MKGLLLQCSNLELDPLELEMRGLPLRHENLELKSLALELMWVHLQYKNLEVKLLGAHQWLTVHLGMTTPGKISMAMK